MILGLFDKVFVIKRWYGPKVAIIWKKHKNNFELKKCAPKTQTKNAKKLQKLAKMNKSVSIFLKQISKLFKKLHAKLQKKYNWGK